MQASGAAVARLRFAIFRSRARRSVLLFLASRSSAYASEIARGTAVTVTNVLGALVGVDGRYAGRLSLVGLGLAIEESVAGDTIRVFRITRLGLALAAVLQPEAAKGP